MYLTVVLRFFVSSTDGGTTVNGSASGGGGIAVDSGIISTPFSSNYTHLPKVVDHFLDNLFPVSAITITSSYFLGAGLTLFSSKDLTGF